MVLKDNFFASKTPQVARNLLGCFLARKIKKEVVYLLITETEAYRGEYDKACHAFRGRTKRTEPMYRAGGRIYVYLIYGMYWMLNIVTEKADFPAAVLIRGGRVFQKKIQRGKDLFFDKEIELNGPGKITKFLAIDKNLNGKKLSFRNGLWVEKKEEFYRKRGRIVAGPRVGVDYAGQCKDWKWNFRLEKPKFY